MAESDQEADFKRQFMARTKEARVARALKQWEIAEALGIEQDQYKQYETRGMLPHRMIIRFCLVCRIEPEWLLTGQGKRAMQPLKIASEAEPKQAKPRKTRAKRVA